MSSAFSVYYFVLLFLDKQKSGDWSAGRDQYMYDNNASGAGGGANSRGSDMQWMPPPPENPNLMWNAMNNDKENQDMWNNPSSGPVNTGMWDNGGMRGPPEPQMQYNQSMQQSSMNMGMMNANPNMQNPAGMPVSFFCG